MKRLHKFQPDLYKQLQCSFRKQKVFSLEPELYQPDLLLQELLM